MKINQAETIEEVINELDKIILWSLDNKSPLGYFPSLYKQVTARVKEGVEQEEFADNHRMERLDVAFANRYLEAFAAYLENGTLTKSWQLTFDAQQQWWPLVLQHLMVGMNAHIHLDLGIAAAQTSPGDSVHHLKEDFNAINALLCLMIDQVQDALVFAWKPLKLIDAVAGQLDEGIAGHGIRFSRDFAWGNALRFSGMPYGASVWDEEIIKLDEKVSKWGNKMIKPGGLFGLTAKCIRIMENKDVVKCIESLNNNKVLLKKPSLSKSE